jgi:flagellar biosynthesis protein FlhF
MATRIKVYNAPADQEDALLARIEREMGPDAKCELRPYKRGGFLGLGAQKMVEVIASLEVDGADDLPPLAQDGAEAAGRMPASAYAPDEPEPASAATPGQSTAKAFEPLKVNLMADSDVQLPIATDEVDSLAALLRASGLRTGSEGAAPGEDAAERRSASAAEFPSYTPLEPPAAAEWGQAAAAPASAPPTEVAAEAPAPARPPAVEDTAPIAGSFVEDEAEYEKAVALDMGQLPAGWEEDAPPPMAADEPAVGALRPAPPAAYETAPVAAQPEVAPAPAEEPAAAWAESQSAPGTLAESLPAAAPSAEAPPVEPPAAVEASVPAPEPAAQPAPVAPPAVAQRPQAAPAAAGGEDGQIGELKESISGLQAAIQLLVNQQQEMLSTATQAAVAAAQAVLEAERQARDAAAPGPAAPPEPAKPPVERRRRKEPVATERRKKAAPAEAPPAAVVAEPVALAVNPLLLDPAGAFGAVQRQVYDRLLDWNIGHYDAVELINSALTRLEQGNAPAADDLTQAISEDICRNVLLGDGIRLVRTPPGKVVALVGATGVGKTTTVAKLAALFAFQHGKRVSLVSLDNYRIAAAEQLRTYSDIMGIDLDIVFSKDEFDAVLTRRRTSDLVLIDTAGRSPNNAKQLYELKDIFSAHPPDEVHLAMPASTKRDDMQLVLEAFKVLSYDHVIVSKLDETRSLGAIYNLTKHCKLPISYFTVGQSVPEDIRTATLPFIQKWITQGRIL